MRAARRVRYSLRKVLFLSSWFPYPPDNGSRTRAYHLLRALAAEHQVSLVALTDENHIPAHVEAIRPFVHEIQTYPRPRYQPRRARALAAFLSNRPRYLVDTFDPALAKLIQHTASSQPFDLIFAGQLSLAVYAARVAHPFKVFDEVETGMFADHRSGGIARVRHDLTWWKYARFLRSLAAHFRALTVVSMQEKRTLQEISIPADKIYLIPNGVDCENRLAPNESFAPNTLIYPGAVTYSANLDAMRYFVREILPHVRAVEPRVRLHITGHAEQVAINELSVDNAVSFTGYVKDIRPYIRASAICIVPLRVGGGTRLKILEAMMLGTPVVSTSKGAEGLDVRDGEHLLLADTPIEFADATLRLFRDVELRQRIACAAQEYVCATYDWKTIGDRLNQVLLEMTTRA